MNEFATFLAEMHTRDVHFAIASDGNVNVQAPAGVLTLDIQRAIRDRKEAILTWLKSEIPLSFYLRPCAHCGRVGEARRRRSDGRWLCPCYAEHVTSTSTASGVA